MYVHIRLATPWTDCTGPCYLRNLAPSFHSFRLSINSLSLVYSCKCSMTPTNSKGRLGSVLGQWPKAIPLVWLIKLSLTSGSSMPVYCWQQFPSKCCVLFETNNLEWHSSKWRVHKGLESVQDFLLCYCLNISLVCLYTL